MKLKRHRLFSYWIYAIYDESTMEIVYIGKCDNIKSRFTNHRLLSTGNSAFKAWKQELYDNNKALLMMPIMVCANEEEQKRVEKKLIQIHKPKFNIQHNG